MIQVKAIAAGYYDHGLRKEGDVFEIKSMKHKGSWMKVISGVEDVVESAQPAKKRGRPAGKPVDIQAMDQMVDNYQTSSSDEDVI